MSRWTYRCRQFAFERAVLGESRDDEGLSRIEAGIANLEDVVVGNHGGSAPHPTAPKCEPADATTVRVYPPHQRSAAEIPFGF